MRHRYGIGAIVAAASLAACATTAGQPRPALLETASQECREQVANIIGGFLDAPFTLGPTAFQNDTRLAAEARILRDAQGSRLDGKLLGKPETFVLMREGDTCVIVRERTQQRALAADCACRPL